MRTVTALLSFGSVLAHSLVSQAHELAVRDITLYIFGGVAQIDEKPRSARDEFLMALSGHSPA
jgi:Zn-dependent protease